MAWALFLWARRNLTYPNLRRWVYENQTSSWAPRTLYYLGYASELRDKPRRAEDCYWIVFTTYGATAWADDAMYRLGVLYEEERRWKEAISVFERLRERFPASEYASKAEGRLNYLYNR